MKTITSIILLIFIFSLTGCSTTNETQVASSIKLPWNDSSTNPTGYTKEHILASWGHPDQVLNKDNDRWGNSQEEWIYIGAYPDLDLPISYRFVKNSNHFHFVGNTVIKREVNPNPVTT